MLPLRGGGAPGAGRPRLATAFALVLALVGPPNALATTPEPRGTMRVRSLKEMREAQVTRQGWDLSCGSAALSTVLTFQHGDPVAEPEIVRAILTHSDPERIRARKGLSLLDLKRFAVRRGYVAEGYGRLELAALVTLAPAIVPTVIAGDDHFVVFRGAREGHVLLADPAFGNRTMTREEFDAIWRRRIAFVVRRDGAGGGRSPLDPAPDLFQSVPADVVRQAVRPLR